MAVTLYCVPGAVSVKSATETTVVALLVFTPCPKITSGEEVGTTTFFQSLPVTSETVLKLDSSKPSLVILPETLCSLKYLSRSEKSVISDALE